MSFRAGDVVLHKPTGEKWLLAMDEENGRVAWSGWPPGLADASDCTLVEAATDGKRLETLERVAAMARSLAAVVGLARQIGRGTQATVPVTAPDPRMILRDAFEAVECGDDDTLWEHLDDLRQRAMAHLCARRGHTPERDQCGRPEHDYCAWCLAATPGEAKR